MDTDDPIARGTLHGELIPRLRDLIVAGTLKPGDKVREAELCARFGVSRTPLREALKVLAAEGLVTLLPNRGAVVATITIAEVEALFPIMGALEALAGELACARIDEAGIAAVRTAHEAMLRGYAAGNRAVYAAHNRAIHEAIFAAAGNEALAQLYQQLLQRTRSVRFLARREAVHWAAAVADHERIMAALAARDAGALAATLSEHLRHKAREIGEALAVRDEPAS